MADLSVHAGKGMELTAFHAVAGLVAGECSGLITSLIAMSLEKRLPGHSYHTLSGQWKRWANCLLPWRFRLPSTG